MTEVSRPTYFRHNPQEDRENHSRRRKRLRANTQNASGPLNGPSGTSETFEDEEGNEEPMGPVSIPIHSFIEQRVLIHIGSLQIMADIPLLHLMLSLKSEVR